MGNPKIWAGDCIRVQFYRCEDIKPSKTQQIILDYFNIQSYGFINKYFNGQADNWEIEEIKDEVVQTKDNA